MPSSIKDFVIAYSRKTAGSVGSDLAVSEIGSESTLAHRESRANTGKIVAESG